MKEKFRLYGVTIYVDEYYRKFLIEKSEYDLKKILKNMCNSIEIKDLIIDEIIRLKRKKIENKYKSSLLKNNELVDYRI